MPEDVAEKIMKLSSVVGPQNAQIALVRGLIKLLIAKGVATEEEINAALLVEFEEAAKPYVGS